MLDDEYVQNYMKINQTTAQIYDNGTLIPLFGFEFYEVMNCPVTWTYKKADNKMYFIQYQILNAVQSGGSWVAPTKSGYTVEQFPDQDYTTVTADSTYFAYKETESTAAAAQIAAGYENDSRTGKAASYIPAHTDYDAGALTLLDEGSEALKFQHTLILGKDALARTGLAGEGNAKMYVKPRGSTGVLDPIDQRQSIGFKINSVGFGSVRTEAVVDYINVPTQLARLVETYRGEKKVPVQGSPMYRPYFGNNMPIILNGIAIYVPLDGQQYEIPESFAAIFLDRISRIDEQINMRKQMAAISDNIESYAGERNLIQKV